MYPRRKFTRKTAFKKRSYKSKSKTSYRRKRSNVVNRSNASVGVGFPKKICTTLKYEEPIVLNCPSGTMGNYQFSLNGLYDPNITGTGHQPMYFDQYTALYDHYCVIGAKATVRGFINPGGANAQVAILINDDTSTTGSSLDSIGEQSQACYTLANPLNTKPFTLTKKWSAKKFFGKDVLANTDLQGTASSNPTEQSYLNVCCQALDKASTCALQFTIMIKYIVVFKELKDMAQS